MPAHLKLPYAYSANAHAQQRAAQIAQLLGKGLPCKVVEVLIGLVTVSFQINSGFNIPNITMPYQTIQYNRPPIQVGDMGTALPTGASVATVAGIDTVTPNMTIEGNLATLSFHPLSTKNWAAVGGGGNAYVLYGVSGGGVILQDSATGSTTTVTINKTGGTVVQVGSLSLTINDGKVTATAGGTPAAVQTTAGPSTVLFADG